MITSQTSSSSLNSVSSLTNEISSGYPEKFKECCVIARKVYIDHRENKKSLTVIVTSHCELIECIENEVSNYINFNHEVTSIEDNEFITSDNVDFDVMTLISDIVVYVVRIKSVLLTIKRKSSQLKILKVFSNVDSFNIKYNKNENSAAIFVTFHDKSQRKINPHCDDLDDLNCIKSEKFMKMIQYATGKSKKARFLLESISKDIEELHFMSTKHLPRVLLSENTILLLIA
ncbi:CLUMA_CG019805, isoform A [Clunio marinus]|uniref:CLUMA_CG019805, isoform A n=1 Tax=Clunio marinus TaxID=568069 RepID=A0A1J1J3H9_9DIPT|nr:CLUMA_CG019805, isoform A [Clunio marinus]